MKSQEVLQEAMRQYDGTIIVVSHNRYFLDCFVNKVLEVRDGKVTEFLGTISEYLYQKQNREAQQVANKQAVVSSEQSLDGAADCSRENRKEQRRLEARKRAERQEKAGPWLQEIVQSEKKIDELEGLKDTLEARLADPELYQDQQAFSQASREYDDCCRRLDRWLERWEKAQQKVAEIDQQINVR
jgi:ATP-binding cassette subfamily F protein 3